MPATAIRTYARMVVWLVPFLCVAEAAGQASVSAELHVDASVPGATIWIDGEKCGQTPGIFTLSTRNVAVKITKSGFADWNDMIRLSPGGRQNAYGELVPSPGTASMPDSFLSHSLRQVWPFVAAWAGVLGTIGLWLAAYIQRIYRTAPVPPASIELASKWDATKDLSQEWTAWTKEVATRHAILDQLTNNSVGAGASETSTNALRRRERRRRLAATDLFVEKAQAVLTMQAKVLTRTGVYCTIVGMMTLLMGVVFLDAMPLPPDELSAPAMLARILRGAAIGGFFLGAAGFPIYLAKAMFHEATQLGNRRHALRFGRLYLYLTGGSIRNFDHLERAFQWSGEFSTGFKEMRHDLPRGTLTEVSKALENLSTAAKPVKDTRKSHGS